MTVASVVCLLGLGSTAVNVLGPVRRLIDSSSKPVMLVDLVIELALALGARTLIVVVVLFVAVCARLVADEASADRVPLLVTLLFMVMPLFLLLFSYVYSMITVMVTNTAATGIFTCHKRSMSQMLIILFMIVCMTQSP